MAKLKMKLASIFAPADISDEILRRLQEMAVMDIETAACDEETAYLPKGYAYRNSDAYCRDYEHKCGAAEDALKILSERFPEKNGLLSFLEGPKMLNSDDFYLTAEEERDILDIAEAVISEDRNIAELNAEKLRLKTSAEQLVPWLGLDVPLDFNGTKQTAAFIGSVTGSLTLQSLLEEITRINGDIALHCEIVYTGKDSTCIFACCPLEEKGAAEAALRELGFARPVSITSCLPSERLEQNREDIAECDKKTEQSVEKIRILSENRERLCAFADFCRAKAEAGRTAGEIAHTESTVLIRGYIAAKDEDYLRKNLEKDFTVVIETEDANEELAPVRLKNNAFASPAETITQMYSLPSAKDIDPTPLTGFFYYLLFGMMLSDAGYGLLMVIGTLLVLKKLSPSPSMRSTMKMFLYCGISTVCWGLFFGSFFGDSIAVISRTFFGREISLPSVIDPMHGGATKLLILSLAIGLVQIIAGLAAKFVTCIKNGDRAAAFFDAGLWITTLVGAALFAVGMFALKPLKTAGAVITLASLAGLILTQGRAHKNPVLRLLIGVKSLYDITGYVSDLLSFSRLMALGLTTAAMGAVFNLLGTLAGNGVAGVCLMIVMFAVGHSVSFALNVLGAYVHTLRLQYVELFSKFYDGGGRPFKSFSIKNKYVGLKNDIKEEN